MARLIIILCLAVSISIVFACRGNREDREHECRNDGEVCIDGRCVDPCGRGWSIASNQCRDHDSCRDEQCRNECRDRNARECEECKNRHECKDQFCCRRA